MGDGVVLSRIPLEVEQLRADLPPVRGRIRDQFVAVRAGGDELRAERDAFDLAAELAGERYRVYRHAVPIAISSSDVNDRLREL